MSRSVEVQVLLPRDQSHPRPTVYMLDGRSANPNRDQLETCLAALEGGGAGIAFASGAAAASAVFQSLKPGDHVICTRDAYHGVLRILREIMTGWELKVSYVDASDLTALQARERRE